ncbi:Uncharacterised protein [uncultured archaeon]|nr:Uncharacterised protein [uncultured archaeon]
MQLERALVVVAVIVILAAITLDGMKMTGGVVSVGLQMDKLDEQNVLFPHVIVLGVIIVSVLWYYQRTIRSSGK